MPRRQGCVTLAAVLALAVCLPATAPAAGPDLDKVVPRAYERPPPGWRMAPRAVLAQAARLPEVRRATRGLARDGRIYQRSRRRWQASFFAPRRRGELRPREVAQVVIDDRTGRVLETWTGVQVTWPMARGYPGAFGRSANAPWLWIALSALFVLPFLRRPVRLGHLDLAVLLAFGLSYAAFNAAAIEVSVPSAYPLLAYLLVRMLGVARGRAAGRPTRMPSADRLAPQALWILTAFLVGVRVALNVVDGNVIDVGYAGVIGADRLAHGAPLYGGFPIENVHGDTYGPALYAAYVPFELLWPWHGSWDALPAAHAAAIAFDLACIALLWRLGRRLGGSRLGALLPYLWVTYPFTLLVSNSGANDALPAALVLLALLVAARPAARGAAAALAGMTKLAPLALLPVMTTWGGLRRAPAALAGAAAVLLATLGPVALGGHLETAWLRTVVFQADRDSPFSVWGLYGLDGLQVAVQVAAAALAVAVAVVPRRGDVGTLAALAAAVLIAVQLGVDHWFYLYLPWFAPLVWIALLAPQASGRSSSSMPSARRGAEARTTTALSQGSSSAAS